jgi:hypothetical protein
MYMYKLPYMLTCYMWYYSGYLVKGGNLFP